MSVLLGNKVTEAEVLAVPQVPWTKTFHPVHHEDVIHAVKQAISLVNMDIEEVEYVLDKDGKRFFALYTLNQGTSELRWSVGVRNALDKSMSLGFVFGSKILVCSNMAFSGDQIVLRRHTSGLDHDELGFLAYKSFKKMIPLLKQFERWHLSLREFSLSEIDSRVLLVEIMANSVIPASKFHAFNDLYHNTYDPSLWGFHEAVTDVLKGNNLLNLPKKNQVLNQILNNYISTLESANCNRSSAMGDFYQQRNAVA